MAERLGEALLDLRTNDAGFTTGVQQAEGKAQRLGAQLDRTSGSSAKLAGEMVATGRSAAQMGAGFDRAGQQVVASAGAQRQGMQQLSFQIGDIATMYSLGARPAQIFASQIGQVTQAVQMMSGGTSRVAAFLGGPWGIALTAATIVLAPFIGKLFEAEDALAGVEFASDKLSDAQSILGGVIDKTTGQINTQSQALLALARAQAAAGMVGAMQRQAAARSELTSISQGGFGDLRIEGSMGGARVVRADNGQDVVELFRQGRLTGPAAEQQLRLRMNNGMISPDDYFRAAQAITSFDVEGANVSVFKDTLAGLDGDAAAARRVFGAQGAPRGGPRGTGPSGGPRARSEAELAGDFSDQSLALERQTLQARLQLATTADERADVQQQLLDLEREQRIAEIEASDLGPARKQALIDQIEALLGTAPIVDEQNEMILSANRGLEGILIARERARQQAFDEMDLADTRFRGEMEMLQNQMALADTQVAQKVIALRIYDAQVAEERIRLQKIIDLEAIGAVTKKEADDARARLAALNANAASGRAVVAQQNETGTERYLRGLNATPGQINEALDNIEIDGLQALNDGLTEAILGAESLGNVFSRVADQIIADLLRIAIQQAIIKPLANSLFGGGGGGASVGSGASGFGALASRFAGMFATGGTIPTGQFGIVGEEGPEIAMAGPGGLGILSNSDSRKLLSGGGSGGTSVSIPISIDATGADAAAIARLNSRLDQLKNELPGTIVTTVRDARDRRFL